MPHKLTRAQLEELKASTNAPRDHAKEETRDLPRWAKLAMARCIFYDETYAEAAKHHGKAKDTLSHYAASPAGKKWRAALEQIADDPVRVAEAMIRGNATGIVFDSFWALDAARQANDFKEVGVIARDLMNRIPELRVQQSEKPVQPVVVLQLGAGSLEPAEVTSTHAKQIEDADYEIVED